MRTFFIVLAGPGLLSAQPAFRTGARLIEVSVVVTDKTGKSVEELTEKDFEVTDNGKPQQLRLFAVQRGQQGSRAGAGLPAGFFSNRLDARGAAPASATVVLIDALNTPREYFGEARKKLAEFLRGLDQRFRVAIYHLGSAGLRVYHDFTADAALLSRKASDAPELLAPGSGLGFVSRVETPDVDRAADVLTGGGDVIDLMAALMYRRERLFTGYETDNRITGTLRAMTAIANRLKAVPGRKNLVWITAGFPLRIGFTEAAAGRWTRDQTLSAGAFNKTYGPELTRAMRALSDASVAVYPVDARGVLALTDAAQLSTNPGAGAAAGQSRFAQRRGAFTNETFITDDHSTMEQAADQTGGRLYFGDAVQKALADVFEDTRISYTLGYYSPDSNQDGRFHTIRVSVNRTGVRVLHRRGYYALPDAQTAERDAKADVLGAVWSPVDATAVPLDVSLEKVSGAAEGERTAVVRVDGKALAFEPAQGGGLRCRLEMFFVQVSQDGKQLEGAFDKLDYPLTKERAAEFEKAGVTHKKLLKIHPQCWALRLVIRNPTTGALGSLTIPLRKRAS